MYSPKILKNMIEICAELGVGKDTVRQWIDMGAPICVEGSESKPRYSAEARELQEWRRKNAHRLRH